MILTKPGVVRDAEKEKIASLRAYVSPVIRAESSFRAYGTVNSTRILSLKTQVGGIVSYLHPNFLEGGLIKAGELILGIEKHDYELGLKKAEALLNSRKVGLMQLVQEEKNVENSLQIARKNLVLSEQELRRYQDMLAQGTVSPQQTEDIQLKLQQQEISVQNLLNSLSVFPVSKKLQESLIDQAEAELKISLVNLKRTELRAPFDCIVQEKNMEKGQFVTVGETLGRIMDYSQLEIAVQLPDYEVNWLLNGFKPFSEEVLIKPLAPQGAELAGEIARLAGEYDEKTRSLKVFIRLNKENPGNFRPGAFCELIFRGRTMEAVHRVARLSLFRENVQFVRNGQLQQAIVKIVREEGDFVYIEPLFEPDDQVVYIFSETLIAGQKLNTEIVEL